MTTTELSLVFFLIGFIEFVIDTWERLVSVRLKFWATVGYSALNQLIDFFMYVFLFSVLIQFWETWHHGVHDYYKLIPYVLYTLGKVGGTTFATWLYAHNKKKTDKDKAVNLLANSKDTKKKKGKKKSRKTTAVEVEHLFDSVEASDVKDEIRAAAIEKSSDIIAEKINEALSE
jgi:hypothetical protein